MSQKKHKKKHPSKRQDLRAGKSAEEPAESPENDQENHLLQDPVDESIDRDSGMSSPEVQHSLEEPSAEEENQTASSEDSALEIDIVEKRVVRRRPSVRNLDEIKHPLGNTWVLWVQDPDKDWHTSLSEVQSFKTVEDFWSLTSHIKPPSKVRLNYSLFKEGIKPEWEDKANASGGRWMFPVSSQQLQLYDDAWKELQLLVIGEIEFGDELMKYINGVYMEKKALMVSVWLNTIEESTAMSIGKIIQDNLFKHMSRSFAMEFTSFQKKKVKRGCSLYRLSGVDTPRRMF